MPWEWRGSRGGGALTLLLHREQVSQLDAGLLKAVRMFQAAGGPLEAKIEELTTDAINAFVDLGIGEVANLGNRGAGHGQDSRARAGDSDRSAAVVSATSSLSSATSSTGWSARARNLVLMGSLYCARRMASLAMASVISGPPISKRIRPGLITATQNSGLPLPEPMRVSAARMVTGLSGKIRIQILREMGEVYMAANKGSSFKVRGFEPRPLLITYPPKNSNSRQRTFNFIQAVTTLGSRFSDENLIQIYKVVGNSNPGRLRTLFIVLNDDDRERCQELAKTSTRFRSRRGDRPQSGSGSVRSSGGGSGGAPGVSFAPVQTSSGFVFGAGAGMDAEAVGLEAGFLNSLRSEPPPPPPSPSRSQRSESRDSRGSSTHPSKDEKSQPSKSSMKRGRHSSESSVETKKSSKRSKSKSKSKRRHRSPSTSSGSSSGSGSGSSGSDHSKVRAREKDKSRGRSRQRSSGSSRSPSPSRKREKGSNRNKEKSKDKNRERSEHRTKDKTKNKPRDKAEETREAKTK